MKISVPLKSLFTVIAFPASALFASIISKDIFGHQFISQAPFFAVYLPILALIWMDTTNRKRKTRALLMSVCFSIVVIIFFNLLFWHLSQNDIASAARFYGYQIIVVLLINTWMYSSIKSDRNEIEQK